ncbi:MAG: hypothetical protein WCG27_10820, partial [Pseudomonadota bacterium]
MRLTFMVILVSWSFFPALLLAKDNLPAPAECQKLFTRSFEHKVDKFQLRPTETGNFEVYDGALGFAGQGHLFDVSGEINVNAETLRDFLPLAMKAISTPKLLTPFTFQGLSWILASATPQQFLLFDAKLQTLMSIITIPASDAQTPPQFINIDGDCFLMTVDRTRRQVRFMNPVSGALLIKTDRFKMSADELKALLQAQLMESQKTNLNVAIYHLQGERFGLALAPDNVALFYKIPKNAKDNAPILLTMDNISGQDMLDLESNLFAWIELKGQSADKFTKVDRFGKQFVTATDSRGKILFFDPKLTHLHYVSKQVQAPPTPDLFFLSVEGKDFGISHSSPVKVEEFLVFDPVANRELFKVDEGRQLSRQEIQDYIHDWL